MAELRTLPVLPLRNSVIFPGATIPIAAGRPASLRAIDKARRDTGDLIFAVTQREDKDEATAANLFTIGTIAHIEQVQRGLAGMQLIVHGQSRGIAVRINERDGHLEAVVRDAEEIAPLNPQDPTFIALYREVRERAAELGYKVGLPPEMVKQVLETVDDPSRFADLVAAYTEAPTRERQDLLETMSVEERLRRVLVHVQRQLAVVSAQEEIKSKVQEELGDRQREMVLREQLKAIQKELGEDGGDKELDELREKLDGLELPPAARKEVDRELGRLLRFGRESMESQVIRTFLETVAELPWDERSADRLDLRRAQTILNEDHYGLSDVKDRVLEYLAVRQLRQQRADQAAEAEARTPAETPPETAPATEMSPDKDADAEAADPVAVRDGDRSRGPILLFVGPPGVGKTSIAKSIARAMGREYVRVSLGGARDQADISGHRRTYVGAMPGRIIQGMKQAGSKNPVFLLDEVDKLGVSFQGDPASALLEVLDPAQNDSFTDHYLGIPFDLSEVLFVATANFLQHIPGPLLDRMEVVEFSGYTESEKLEIARRYLLPRQLDENAVLPAQLDLGDETLVEIVTGYTREAGVRQLERELGKLLRKVARRIAAREVDRVAVGVADVRDLLGRPRVHPEHAATSDQIGVATGMYYTPAGGDIMFVEASPMPGKGRLVLTGQLGDVMRESAQAAWSWARAHAAALHIPAEAFESDLHIHVPAGAIPKDGPSAGITMATAVVSALARRRVRPDTAMTGEITLSGRVLPIGGVKEKILGAVRAGIRRFVLPARNEADLADLPVEVRDSIEVHAVAELGQVLALTLRDARFERGRLLFPGDDPGLIEPLSEVWADGMATAS